MKREKKKVCETFSLHIYKALYIECVGTYEKNLMDKWWHHLFLLSIIPLCYSQGIPLTQPTLLPITPINSTALNVSWQFASPIYDQSTLIEVDIDFYEFYYNYGPVNYSVDYTFTPANKTITSLVENFELVNAFYYVCFSSNSTNSNTTVFLFVETCQLKQTCLRSNSSCPQNGFVVISQSSITSNSFIINVLWLQNLLYTQNATSVQLTNGATGTALSSTQNSTYINLPYQFSGLQSQTSYTVIITVSYIVFGQSMTNVMNYTVTTSRSSNLFHTGNILIFVVWSVLLSFVFS